MSDPQDRHSTSDREPEDAVEGTVPAAEVAPEETGAAQGAPAGPADDTAAEAEVAPPEAAVVAADGEPPSGTAGGGDAESKAEASASAGEAEQPEPAADVAAAGGTSAEATGRREPEKPELRALRVAFEKRQSVEGRVIGWNNGGFHLVINGLAAFCPRSEMELVEAGDPAGYLDQTFAFRVLRIQKNGRRIVVSRAADLRAGKARQRAETRKKISAGAVLEGVVTSLTDFGAFVDLGAVQGLVHVSEIARRRVEHPSDALEVGQKVHVRVLKVEKGGRRISLSMRALEPDPWRDLADRFPRGAIVTGRVEKATPVGAFIELAPGITGLLPARSMAIPRETTPARAYPPGKEVSVQIISVDPRRHRIALAPEGSSLEGSRADYQEYLRHEREADTGDGFNALASAFRRIQSDSD